MYCSHCGSVTADELNFCKNCGARNELTAGREDTRMRGLALCAAGAIGVVGLVGFFPILRELLHTQNMMPGYIFLIMAAYLLAVVVMFTIFISVGRRLTRDQREPRFTRAHPDQPAYLRPANTAQLHEPHDMPASVTEHTTRTLEEVPLRER